jgi:glycosyltransferase involved in cell wall biosynthesis
MSPQQHRPQQGRRVLMVGPSLEARGGMSAVVQCYAAAGLFEQVPLEFVASYEAGSALRRLLAFLPAAWRVGSLMLRGRVAGLHLHSAARGSFWRKSMLAAMARAFGVPYIFHIHSGEFLDFHERQCGPRAKRWVAHTLGGAREVLLLTPGWRQAFEHRFPGLRAAVLPNPVLLPDAVPPRAGPQPTVLFLGRIRGKKGVFDLIDAMQSVHRALPDARLVLAGDGEVGEARGYAAAKGLAEVVELPGWLDGEAKQRALAACDVLALPSYFEGLPVGVLEAMASGRLVVATRVGGIPDLIRDGENGLLVEPGNAAQLAAALLRALADVGQREAMVAQAREDVRPYAAQQVVAALLGCYQRAWGSGSGPGSDR